MPIEARPLFRPDALRPKLAGFSLLPAVERVRVKLHHWTDLLGSKRADAMKETELLPDFIRDVFMDLLGYVGPAGGLPAYSLKREALVEVDGKRADAALGRFTPAGDHDGFVAVLEGKGPRDPLDRPFAGRKRSAVEQALQYAVNLRIDWYLVTNLKEIRLYHKGHDQFTFERFETAALAADEAALKRFVFLLGGERVVPAAGRNHLDALLADSHRIGLDLTRHYYAEYAGLRRQTFDQLRRHNPDVPPAEVLAATQKVLDRVLFIAFCEDRGLLPAESIASAFRHRDPYNPRPVWENFKGLFRAVDEGSPHLHIERYNGGLFAHDELLERLTVPAEQRSGRQAVFDWLRVEYAVAKPSLKLQALTALDLEALVAEVKKARGKKQPLTVAGLKALKDEHARSITPLQGLAAEARGLERRVADLVNAAYGLTPEEVALMWQTAPPRMPA